MISVWTGQNRVTWKTPSSPAFVPLQEPVTVLALLRSPHLHAGMMQYECGLTQPLFRAGHDHGKTFFLICIFLNTVTIKITIQYFDLKDNSASHNTKSSYEDDTNCSQKTDYNTISFFNTENLLFCFAFPTLRVYSR